MCLHFKINQIDGTLITTSVNLGKFLNCCEFKFPYLLTEITGGLDKNMGAKRLPIGDYAPVLILPKRSGLPSPFYYFIANEKLRGRLTASSTKL